MDVSCLYWLLNSQYAKRYGGKVLDPADGTEVVVACLAAMSDAVTRRGARLHVLCHHLEKPQALPASAWADFRRRTGAIDISERVRPPNAADPIAFDGIHWNAVGQKRVAAVVKEQLEAASAR